MENKKPVTDKNKCNLCGECSRICPTQAWEMIGKKVTTEEVKLYEGKNRKIKTGKFKYPTLYFY